MCYVRMTYLLFIFTFPKLLHPFFVPLFLSLTLSPVFSLICSSLHCCLPLCYMGKHKNAPCCFCGLELTFCSLSNTCKCSGDTDRFNPFPCCIWECGKRLTAVVLHSNSWKFHLPTAELRCAIQCVVSLYNSISGNPSASELPWMNFSTVLWRHLL